MQVIFFLGIPVWFIMQVFRFLNSRLAQYAGILFCFEIPVWPIMHFRFFGGKSCSVHYAGIFVLWCSCLAHYAGEIMFWNSRLAD